MFDEGKASLVMGVGINDANYPIKKRVCGKQVQDPFYAVWSGMLERCYSDKYHQKKPTYKDCTVCDEWLTFSNFKSWMERQDWEGKHLDKDFLSEDVKIYSPRTCVFVNPRLNAFFKSPKGFTVCRRKFKVSCKNPFTKMNVHLGLFRTKEEAYTAWLSKKICYLKDLLDSGIDDNLRSALLSNNKWKGVLCV